MNLVVGATGFLGGEICRRLAASGEPFRALVRPTSDAARVAGLRELGAELVEGDLKDPSSLEPACRGVRTVISTAATTLSRQPGDSIDDTDRRGQKRLVDAAVEAGAEHFIYISVPTFLSSDDPFIAAKREVESHLRDSGLAYTNLQPTSFMEVWLDAPLGWDLAGGRVRILGEGDVPHSWVSLGDVAEFAVRAAGSPGARHRDIQLGGPEPLTPRDALAIVEEEARRSFEVEHLPAEALEAQVAGAEDPYERTLASLALTMATEPGPIEMEETAREFGVALTSVRDHFRRALGKATG